MFSTYYYKQDSQERKTNQSSASLTGPAAKIALQAIFPEEFRSKITDFTTSKDIQKLLTELYEKYPDKYAEVVDNLMRLSKNLVYIRQIFSPRYEDFSLPPQYYDELKRLHLKQQEIYKKYYSNPDKLYEELNNLGVETLSNIQKKLLEDEKLKDNSFVVQTKSGARGNPAQLTGLIFSDIVYSDNKGDLVPILITRRFIQGLYPHQIWAGSYGARFGLYFQQHGTRVSGAINKQLIQRTHDLVVVQKDSPDFYKYKIGYPVSTSDSSAAGSLLAQPIAGIPQNTLITPQLLAYFRQKGIDKILIRSPITAISANGQLSAYDVGIRERGTLPAVGDFIGVVASQALTEPLTQAQLSAKHTGGVKGTGRAQDFLQEINAFLEPSESMGLMAVHSDIDGVVKEIKDLDVGGKRIVIKTKDGEEHSYYASDSDNILVKEGDQIEAGDMLIEGIPNMASVVEHKGIGEGRRLFIEYLDKLLQSAGIKAHRKNLEIVATGIVGQVLVEEPFGPFYPGDIVSYNKVAYYYKPRKDAKRMKVNNDIIGKYLEEPVLHYSIGTKIRPSVVKMLKEFGIDSVLVHDQKPFFSPVFFRILDQMEKHEGWMERMLGQHLQKGLLDALRRGSVSKFYENSSFVPALAKGIDFARTPYTIGPKEKTIQEARLETENLREKTRKLLARLGFTE